jgi:hypothetical protein
MLHSKTSNSAIFAAVGSTAKTLDGSFLKRILLTTALSLALVAGIAGGAQAVTVIVVGDNGADSFDFTPAGGGESVSADAGYLVPNTDNTNSATATGGNGGGSTFTPGGSGGSATSTAGATTTNGGASTASANAAGGSGGSGGSGPVCCLGGFGGSATSTATAAAMNGGTSTASAGATGGDGARGDEVGGSGGAQTLRHMQLRHSAAIRLPQRAEEMAVRVLFLSEGLVAPQPQRPIRSL